MKDIIYELWLVLLKTIWLALAALVLIGAVRLMAWADTGSRGECPIEESILP